MIKKVYLENFRGFKKHSIDFKNRTIIVGKNNAGKSTLVEALRIVSLIAKRYQNLASEVGWMGDGLQMWLQTIWFLALSKNSDTVILDEPDVYMHPDLQRRLVRFISNRYDQIIIATHSVEIISEVEPENILVLNKGRKESNFTTSLPAVQNILDKIGTVHNLQLARLWSAKKLVLVEGSDLKILKQFQNLLYPHSLEPLDAVPNMSINGWGGWNYAIGSSMLLKNSVGDQIKIYCILDSDYHSESEIKKKYKESKERRVSLKIWKKKEIENYLLKVNPINRYINENKQKDIPISKDLIIQQLNKVTEKVKNNTIEQVATTIAKENKSYEGGTVTKRAREFVEKNWDQLEKRLDIIPGKETLKLLSDWCLVKYGTNISPTKLVSYFKLSEIPKEIKQILNCIEN